MVKDWDVLEVEFDVEFSEEKFEGEAALNEFF